MHSSVYPETRDMLVAFLTLVTSVFSISMVFAEKFVAADGGPVDRGILYVTWGLFFLAIALGGWALHQLHIAGSLVYMGSDNQSAVTSAFRNTLAWGETGGAFFGLGLLGLAFSAFRRIRAGRIVVRSD